MEKTIPMGYLVSILTQLKYMFMTAFTHLGLFKSSEEAIYSGELHSTTTTSTSNENNNHVLMWDGSSPCLVPVPIPVVTAFIKKTLPVVLFSDLLEGEDQSRGRKMNEHDSYDDDDDDDDFDDDDVDGGEERKEMGCSVCWDCIEGNHKIRELSWCSHVFHKECLDRWVDEGQHTCPLCRSMLLPPNTSPWLLLRNADSHTPPTQQQQLHTTATT